MRPLFEFGSALTHAPSPNAPVLVNITAMNHLGRKSVLRRDLPRNVWVYDLSVLHDEGVIAKLEAVVRRLGLPQDAGDVADAVQVSITP
jgi:hypothetical protein